MILVTTIEHSGTFFLFGLLGYPKRKVYALEEYDKAQNGDIIFAHLYDFQMEKIIKIATTMPTMTTLRDWDKIENSWKRRGKPLDQLNIQKNNYNKLLDVCHPTIVKLGEHWPSIELRPTYRGMVSSNE